VGQYRIELWAKLLSDRIAWAVRAPAGRWVALLLKDFEHHGMLGDFNDVKLLTAKGVDDRFMAEGPGQKFPKPRRRAGVHT
jgi:hypothetical protein